MKYFKNIKNILISLLLLVVFFYQFKDCSNKPNTTTDKVDTVYQQVKVEVPKYIPKWRTKIKTVKVPSDSLKPIDTVAVVTDYYSKYKTVDTLVLNYPDSSKKIFGYGIVTDITTRNAISERKVVWNYKIPTVIHTITHYQKPKAQLYVGATANINSLRLLSSVSGTLLYKTKRDRIYIASVGVANDGLGVQPFIGGGVVWKITLKNPIKPLPQNSATP
jgi:hypothetical protein